MNIKKRIYQLLILVLAVCFACSCTADVNGEKNFEEDDTFRFGVSFTLDSLDSFRNSSNSIRVMCDALHGYLLWWDTDNQGLEGELASEWTWVSDMELLILLNRNFRFSNGRGVVADDVVYTFERILDPAWGCYHYSTFSEILASVTAQDDYTVRFNLRRADTIFLMRLAQIPIMCREAEDALGTAPIGCGPFSFVSWNQSDELVMERNVYYPKSGARSAEYSNLVIRSYGTQEDLYRAFVDEEVDSMQIEAADLLSVTADTDAYIQGGLGNSYYLTGNQNNKILNTWGVMQAIKYAVDRDEILDLALYGFGNTTLAPLPLDSPFYPEEYEYSRDLDYARRLLKEAGYPNGFSIELTVMDYLSLPQIAYLLKSQLGEIGINVQIRIVDTEEFIELWQQGDFELAVYNTAIAYEPASKYRQWLSTNQTNYVNYENVMFDHLFEVAGTTQNEMRQEKYYAWLHQVFFKDAVVQYMVNNHVFYAVHQGWSGLESHFGILDFTSLRRIREGG